MSNRKQLIEEFRADMAAIEPDRPNLDEAYATFKQRPTSFKYMHADYLFKIWSAGRKGGEGQTV